MAQVEGHCDDQFAEVRTLLKNNIDADIELGASITVNLNGEDVVDIWGGHVDEERRRIWEKDTIVNIFSTTKLVTNIAILVLVDRGLLRPDDKIAKYWPEFGMNGKQDIEIRHVMSHSSGVPGFEAPLTLEEVCDVATVTPLLAQQSPWWTPGTASGYHSLTQGYLLGEIVRRVTGKSLTRFIAEDVAGPLNADFQLGCAKRDEPRRSNVVPPPQPPPGEGPPPPDPGSIQFRVFANPPMDAAFANGETFRAAEMGAGNGHSNARGVNRILSAVALKGQVNTTRFLAPQTVDLVFKEQVKGLDHVIPTDEKPVCFGLGFALPGKDTWIDWLPEGKVGVWGGYGGSLGIVDLERGLTITYVMNKMQMVGLGGERAQGYVHAVYRALGVGAA